MFFAFGDRAAGEPVAGSERGADRSIGIAASGARVDVGGIDICAGVFLATHLDSSSSTAASEKVGTPHGLFRAGGLKILTILLSALLLAIFAGTSLLAWHGKTVTVDEPIGIAGAWLQTHHGDFRVDPEDPPLWKYLAALGTRSDQLPTDAEAGLWRRLLNDTGAQWEYAPSLLFANPAVDADGVIQTARRRMILAGIALGGVIAWWGWRLSGALAGVIALFAYSLDPNFLAHAALVKNDVPMTLGFLLLMAAVWLAGERLTLFRGLSVALLTGAALSIKYSGVLAIPMVGAALLIRALLPEPWAVFSGSARTRKGRIPVATGIFVSTLIVSYVVLWAAYDFRFLPGPEGSGPFDLNEEINICRVRECFVALNGPMEISEAEGARWDASWRPHGVVALGIWANQHHLLPQTWIVGFLYTYANGLARPSFLLGKIRGMGWWYYFPLAMIFKTPLATLAGIVLCAGYWIVRRRRIRAWWPIFVFAIAPIFYMAAALHSHIDLGLRHVLPVYPFLFIFLGVTAAEFRQRRASWGPRIILFLAAALAIETYSSFPNFISFFNVACAPWPHYALLGDSNIDWQQDLPTLAEWQRTHPGYQMYLFYRGSADPRYFGLHYVNMIHSNAKPDETQPNGLRVVYAITPWAFQDLDMPRSEQKFYSTLRNRKPLAVLNDCVYLYDQH
jgi:hypothetical protein